MILWTNFYLPIFQVKRLRHRTQNVQRHIHNLALELRFKRQPSAFSAHTINHYASTDSQKESWYPNQLFITWALNKRRMGRNREGINVFKRKHWTCLRSRHNYIRKFYLVPEGWEIYRGIETPPSLMSQLKLYKYFHCNFLKKHVSPLAEDRDCFNYHSISSVKTEYNNYSPDERVIKWIKQQKRWKTPSNG